MTGFEADKPDSTDVDESPGPDDSNLMSGASRVWVVSCLLAAAGAVSLMKTVFGKVLTTELVAGLILAAVNGAAGILINVIAIRKKREGFVAWGAVGNILRTIGILVIILVVKKLEVVKFEFFITAFLVSYFVFLFAETARLNLMNMKGRRGA